MSLFDILKNYYIDNESDIPKDYMPLVESALESQEDFHQDNIDFVPRKDGSSC